MAGWSTLLRSAGLNFGRTRLLGSKFAVSNAVVNPTLARNMSGHNMVITASRWQWHKTKDMVHFYFLVAAIPCSIITFCVNVFVGPATLTPIPEDYEPDYWEYYKHPITRFLARYIFNNPQKDYEKNMHMVWEEGERIKIRRLEKKIWDLQAERQDYKYSYFLPYDNFATREFREIVKHERDNMN